MFGLGVTELLIILVAILVLFGAGKLPNVLGDLGKGLSEFKKGMAGLKDDEQKTAATPSKTEANVTVVKATPKKLAAKKTTAKKTSVKTTAKKAATKKAAPKKATAKKTAAKKPAAKKKTA